MSDNFKPLLASKIIDPKALIYPVYVSPKLDGIRAVVKEGFIISRNLKPIANRYTNRRFSKLALSGLDGELIYGDPTSPTVFRDTSSAVMSTEGKPDVDFYVFDDITHTDKEFQERLEIAKSKLGKHCILVPQILVHSVEELLLAEERFLEEGYEGVMVRSVAGVYKFGKSTLKEGILLKLKRFEDAEATVIGFEEEFKNTNIATRGKLGKLERSSHKEGMVGKNTLGALIVIGYNGTYKGVEFNVGSGFNKLERKQLWRDRDSLVGKLIKFKYFPIGCKDKPRFPVFQGFRDERDM